MEHFAEELHGGEWLFPVSMKTWRDQTKQFTEKLEFRKGSPEEILGNHVLFIAVCVAKNT